ncbi:MAG TPA: hypothetical protein VML96_04295 [Egibacteraceae bacterium]|nr:hypothetical protein [Egibacteraceae bacterium]
MLQLFKGLRGAASRMTDRLADERGGVVVEYGIVVVTIAIGLIAAGAVFVAAVLGWFGNIAALFPL